MVDKNNPQQKCFCVLLLAQLSTRKEEEKVFNIIVAFLTGHIAWINCLVNIGDL